MIQSILQCVAHATTKMKLALILALAVCSTQIFELVSAKKSTVCVTPNSEPGYCVPLLWCPELVKALGKYQYEEALYFENSKCGNFKVCCGAWTRYDSSRFVDGDQESPVSKVEYEIPKTRNETLSKNRNFALNHFVLPLKRYCGLQHADDRLYSDNETALDEAPWLVNFVGQYALAHRGPPKRDDYYAYCAGVLISNHHVLSSSYCSFKRFNIEAARLGQYHPRKNVSCVSNTGEEDEECTNKFVDIPIQKHLRLGNSNIFIYSLARNITFTDYIRPICLPLNDTKRPVDGDTVISSGWGAYSYALIAKKRVVNKIVSEQHCSGFNDSVRFGKVNRKYGMCVQNQESSNAKGNHGDQGGPLTFSIKHKWYLDGIINFVRGDYLIGEKITPQIFDWILDALYHFYEKPTFF